MPRKKICPALKKERKLEYQRQYRKKYPEKVSSIKKRYIENNPSKYAEIQRNYRQKPHGRAVSLLNGARRRAKEKGMECSISKEWVEGKILNGFCELTNIPFDMSVTQVNRRRPFSPSIDRIDNNIGYTETNCRLVLSAINVALNEWGDELFTKIATAYLNNMRV